MHRREISLLLLAALITVQAAACGSDNQILLEQVELAPRTMGSPALVTPSSCEALEEKLRFSLKQEMRISLLMAERSLRYQGGVMPVFGGGPEADMAEPGGGGERVYSRTNSQEAASDEADIVKTNGNELFVLSDSGVNIFDIPEAGSLVARAFVPIEGYPVGMLLSGGRLLVISWVGPWDLASDNPLNHTGTSAMPGGDPGDGIAMPDAGYWWSSILKITVIGVSNPSAPVIEREIYTEGDYRAGRLNGDITRIVVYGGKYPEMIQMWPDFPISIYDGTLTGLARDAAIRAALVELIARNDSRIDRLRLEDFAPLTVEKDDDSYAPVSLRDAGCQNFWLPDDSFSRGFSAVLTLGLATASEPMKHQYVVSNTSHVYSSEDALVLADDSFASWWFWDQETIEPLTNLHRFSLEGGATSYAGSGRVEGLILNQFSLSMQGDRLRVAATTGGNSWWWSTQLPSPPENHVYVLSGETSLETEGHLGGIAIGERIWAARFLGDKGFLVTFRNIDPLWTVDLSDPAQPEIIGELEVPGVSTYIHPLNGGNHLLTVGFSGDETGLDWTTQIALFDVSDFGTPVQQSTFAPGGGGGWSEAIWEHKAFQYWEPRSLLALPYEIYRWDGEDYEYSSSLELVHVDTDGGELSGYGSLVQVEGGGSCSFEYCMPNRIRRAVFAGDHVYVIGSSMVSAFNLESLEETASGTLGNP